ncbi:MAG: proteasome accessory factor PafA2 family protein [Gemmatimonadales bacterium]
MRTLMGMETEYAITGLLANGTSAERGQLVGWLLEAARQSFPHLPDNGGGIFLANGARFYADRGCHPEYATPECGDPWEAARYARAGDAILLELAERVRTAHPELRELMVFRANVDYGRDGATWGCHESYLHSRPPLELPSQLIPHFVTRILYAGAGGFNPMVPGPEFTLSPRAWLLPNATAHDSTGERGIFHTRDEPLAGPGWYRLHVICGESLCSETATVLKLGTTALILAAIDAGRRPGDAVRLADPVQAIRTVAADTFCAQGLRLDGGGQLGAREIQWHYLAEVEACRPDQLPAWAGDLCCLWREHLIALETRAESITRRLDWAIKQALYQRWVKDRMSWENLLWTGYILKELERTALYSLQQGDPERLFLTAVLAGAPPSQDQLDRLTPLFRDVGTTAEDFRRDLQLRNQLRSELYEADLRFGQLGERGIFNQLDRTGLLEHRVRQPGPEAGTDARLQPPAGRARLRGEWVERLWRKGNPEGYRSDWTAVWNEWTGRTLDLADPFATAAKWR